jgi:hypothetical protein
MYYLRIPDVRLFHKERINKEAVKLIRAMGLDIKEEDLYYPEIYCRMDRVSMVRIVYAYAMQNMTSFEYKETPHKFGNSLRHRRGKFAVMRFWRKTLKAIMYS